MPSPDRPTRVLAVLIKGVAGALALMSLALTWDFVTTIHSTTGGSRGQGGAVPSSEAWVTLDDVADVADADYSGGRWFISDPALHRVHVIDTLGNYRFGFGRRGRGPGEFSIPLAVAVVGERVHVSDLGLPHVLVFDTTGAYLDRVDLTDPACVPGAVVRMVALTDGAVGLQRCMAEGSVRHRLVHFGPTGEVTPVETEYPESPPGHLPVPVLASDGKYTLAAGDGQLGCVRVFRLGESGRRLCPDLARRPLSREHRERMERTLQGRRSDLLARLPDSLPAFDGVAVDSVIHLRRPMETGATQWFSSPDGFLAPDGSHAAGVRPMRRRGRYLGVREVLAGISVSFDPGR